MTEKVKITGPKAMDLLREVAAGREDYVYAFGSDSCVNFWGGQPSCIVGHVLDKLGVSAGMAQDLDVDGPSGYIRTLNVLNDGPEFGYEFETEAYYVLGTAQVFQDAKQPWGKAVQAAQRALEEGRTIWVDEDGVEDEPEVGTYDLI